nr:hypothetical protein [Tanacetum cinerariifolium]
EPKRGASIASLEEIKENLAFICKHETLPAATADTDVLFKYARWLQKNNQLKQDPATDVEVGRLYRIAAENGHVKANINLQNDSLRGKFRLQGHEHLRFSQVLIDADVATGYYFVSLFLKNGIAGLEKDMEKSLRYLRKAADGGSAQAQYEIGDALAPSDVAPQIAVQMYRCAADQGQGEAASTLGVDRKYHKQYREALEAFQLGVAAGDETSAGWLDDSFRGLEPTDKLYYLGLDEDLERAQRYKTIWRILTSARSQHPAREAVARADPAPDPRSETRFRHGQAAGARSVADPITHPTRGFHMKGIIRIGDSTTGGGTVKSGSDSMIFDGLGAARVGDIVVCPLPGHGANAIAEGNAGISAMSKDNKTLAYFDAEMRYLHRAASEFATQFPDRAAALNLDKPGAIDPAVEELFQRFAFLMARTREKLDDDLPELTEGLMEMVEPQFLRMIPSLSIVELTPEIDEMKTCETLPKGFEVRSQPVGAQRTRCRYTTTQDMTLRALALDTVRVGQQPNGQSVIRLHFSLGNLPEKFMNLRLKGLEHAQFDVSTRAFELEVVLRRPWPHGFALTAEHIRLHTVSVINLFALEAEPVTLDALQSDYPVRPLHLEDSHAEIYSVDSVIASKGSARHSYVPFTHFQHKGGMMPGQAPERYFHTRLKRAPSGSSVTWLVLGGDGFDLDRSTRDQRLSLQLTGTDGRLPRMALAETVLDEAARVGKRTLRVRNLCVPTMPCYPPDSDRAHWNVLGHLGSTFLPMLESAEVLRHTLALYDWTGSEVNRRRVQAITEV